MDQAKAIINLNEGIIQFEGPVEFVRYYLDLYRPAGGGRRGIASTQARATQPVRGKRVQAKRIKTKRVKAKRVSCIDAIRAEIESGFFEEAKSTQEVKTRLDDKGMTGKSNSIRMSLKRLSDSGLLVPLKEGRSIRYHRSG